MTHRLPLRILTAACVAAALAVAPCRAQTTQPQPPPQPHTQTPTPPGSQTLQAPPQPGLWESDARVQVNGLDVTAGLRSAQDVLMRVLPASQRQQMAAMVASQAGSLAGGKTRQCLSAADAARFARPEDALMQLQRSAPRCRFEQPEVNGAQVDFKGRCDDPQGFTGDVSGRFTMTSPTEWQGRFGGRGRIARADQMAGLQMGDDGQVDLQAQTRSIWLSADCGAVGQPTPTR